MRVLSSDSSVYRAVPCPFIIKPAVMPFNSSAACRLGVMVILAPVSTISLCIRGHLERKTIC